MIGDGAMTRRGERGSLSDQPCQELLARLLCCKIKLGDEFCISGTFEVSLCSNSQKSLRWWARGVSTALHAFTQCLQHSWSMLAKVPANSSAGKVGRNTQKKNGVGPWRASSPFPLRTVKLTAVTHRRCNLGHQKPPRHEIALSKYLHPALPIVATRSHGRVVSFEWCPTLAERHEKEERSTTTMTT